MRVHKWHFWSSAVPTILYDFSISCHIYRADFTGFYVLYYRTHHIVSMCVCVCSGAYGADNNGDDVYQWDVQSALGTHTDGLSVY